MLQITNFLSSCLWNEFTIVLVTLDCTDLPTSMNGHNYPPGCPGAVWHNGDPSELYCNGKNGAYPWWSYCCYWTGTECRPKSFLYKY